MASTVSLNTSASLSPASEARTSDGGVLSRATSMPVSDPAMPLPETSSAAPARTPKSRSVCMLMAASLSWSGSSSITVLPSERSSAFPSETLPSNLSFMAISSKSIARALTYSSNSKRSTPVSRASDGAGLPSTEGGAESSVVGSFAPSGGLDIGIPARSLNAAGAAFRYVSVYAAGRSPTAGSCAPGTVPGCAPGGNASGLTICALCRSVSRTETP